MIDITKDEFWDSKHEEVTKITGGKVSIKQTILKNKLMSAIIIIFSVCIFANIVLIYSFFKMIKLL